MPAQIVELQQAETVSEDSEIFFHFRLILDVVHQLEIEAHPSRHALDLARIRHTCPTVDGIFKFHFAQIGVSIQRGKARECFLADEGVRELQAGEKDVVLLSRAEKTQHDFFIFIRYFQHPLSISCFREQGTHLSLQRTSGNDGLVRHRISHEDTIHRTDGSVVIRPADVKPRLDRERGFDDEFP